MDATEKIFLRLDVMGETVNPVELSAVLGVTPTRTFAVGESRLPKSKDLALWSWDSDVGELEVLLEQFGVLFDPRRDVLRKLADQGASVALTIMQDLVADVLTTSEEAETRGWWGGEEPGETFRPFLALQSAGVYVGVATLRLLADMGAALDTFTTIDLGSVGQYSAGGAGCPG
jgi:hypothetical protein